MGTDFKKEFESFKELILDNNPDSDIGLIKKAYDFGAYHHDGQKRNSGEDYFIHPIAVASNLSNMKLDDETICAGLMHDVLEDTDVTRDEMQDIFGKEITFLVDGVTKLKNLNYNSKEEKQAENIRKMVMAMAKDVRVVLIKLADRLHNMRTLEYMTRKKQIQKANETLEIYVPLAHRLGIYSLKWELEDLCFRYQEPDKYYELAEMVSVKRREREAYATFSNFLRIAKMKSAETKQMPASTLQMTTRLTLAPHIRPGIMTSWLPMAVAANQSPIIKPAYFGGATLLTKLMPMGERRSSAKVRTR